MAQVSSISRVGTTEPFELQVARGQISYHRPLFKFGFNADVQNVEETIWDLGGLYPYPAAAGLIYASSTATTDTSAGTGARTIFIGGLDANYNEVSETVTLNGQTQVATTNNYIRVYRAYVITAGSGGTAAGDIYIGTSGATAGVPNGTTYARITLGHNQTLMTPYTVPAGHTLYLSRGTISSGTASAGNQFITARLVARSFGGVFRTQTKITLVTGFIDFDWEIPLAVTEKSDIEVRAVVSLAQSNALSATYEGYLVKNDAD